GRVRHPAHAGQAQAFRSAWRRPAQYASGHVPDDHGDREINSGFGTRDSGFGTRGPDPGLEPAGPESPGLGAPEPRASEPLSPEPRFCTHPDAFFVSRNGWAGLLGHKITGFVKSPGGTKLDNPNLGLWAQGDSDAERHD